MNRADVVALEIVLGIGLPVAGQIVRAAQGRRSDLQPSPGQQDLQRGDMVRQRCGPDVHRGEDQPAPGLQPQGQKAEFARVKPLRRAESRRRPQPPVQGIAPAVIGADQFTLAMAARAHDQRPGPVATDIVKGAQGAVLAPDRQQAMPRDVGRDPVAGGRHLGIMAQEQPGLAEHGRTLARPGVRTAVQSGGKRGLHGGDEGPGSRVPSTGLRSRSHPRRRCRRPDRDPGAGSAA